MCTRILHSGLEFSIPLWCCLHGSALAIGSSCGWHLYPFGFVIPLLDGFVSLALPYFLEWQDLPGSSCLLPAPVLESAMVPLLQSGVRVHNLAIRRAHCCWDVIMIWPSQLIEQGSICGWICNHLYVY